MAASAYEGLDRLKEKIVLVTGAGGFVGREMTKTLLAAGVAEVRAMDVSVATIDPSAKTTLLEVDLALAESDLSTGSAVLRGVTGVDAVVHIASYGMSGPAMLDRGRIHAVNVGGTKVLLDACLQNQVQAFVYTSTYNVVFGGQEIINGDEDSCPYFPLDLQVDEYSKTKTLAEQLVLSYNGLSHVGAQKTVLRCCAIRPNAIYGEGEERHFPRIIDLALRGLTRFTIGKPDSKTDWVHVSNLVSAHLLAVDNLLIGSETLAAGEAFFVSDGHPVNQWDFLNPLLRAVGSKPAVISFPTWLMLIVAYFLEKLYQFGISRWIFNYVPLLTRAEVNKSSVTHFCSNSKAARILGYKPLVRHPAGIQAVAAHWQKRVVSNVR